MKITKVIISLMAFLVLPNCSTLNKNLIKRGEYKILGGVSNKDKWEENLIFQRISWFKELTLSFDLLDTKIEKSSPFYNWFSEDEKSMLDKCIDFRVVVTYAWSPLQISRSSFFNNMEEQGYSRIGIPVFQKNLKMHPNFARLNISLYKTDALCREKAENDKIMLRFPGFTEVPLLKNSSEM